jgi:Flp pilus assembly protein TadG
MHTTPKTIKARKGALLSLEMVIALPVLLIVVLAAVEFSFLLLASQAITAAANVGARQAALPSTTADDVEEAVYDALASWRWANPALPYLEVHVFVDGDPDGPGNELEDSTTGTQVQVTVNLPSDQAAPDLLGIIPALSIQGQELTSSFITRRE